MVTEKQIFKQGYFILREAKIEDAEFDAKQLFEFCFNHKVVIPLVDAEATNDEVNEKYIALCKRRANREPLQYLLGFWEFFSLPFKVSNDVLIPRPDTEVLVETALKYINKNNIVYDFCTGSGCIGITLAHECNCKAVLFDISEKALNIAKENALLNKVKVSFEHLDILKETPDIPCDVLVCNPPYLTEDEMNSLQQELKFEPSLALYGGNDGLTFYKALATLQAKALKTNGYMILEIGETQAHDIIDIFVKNRFDFTELIKDYSGNDRVLVFRKI